MILCFGLAVVSRQYLGYALVALLIEVNSVFLHVRQMLIVQGMVKHAKPYRLNSLLNVGEYCEVDPVISCRARSEQVTFGRAPMLSPHTGPLWPAKAIHGPP